MKNELIENNLKQDYIKRLGKPYIKKGTQKFFLDQFAAGAGNELNVKFWNKRSSSRFAFDLYSWMAYDDSIVDFEFEYHLPGMKSGGMGPNMDVYIETAKDIIFIESKFSEMANLHFIDNGYLSKAYYLDEAYGRRKMYLSERYYDHGFASQISKFCIEFENEMKNSKWHSGIDWFEPKQETCHLIGILLYLKNNEEYLKDKRIRFCNIYYSLKNDIKTELYKAFEKSVSELLENIKSQLGGITIEFKAFSVQEMLNNNSLLSDAIKFPKDINESIKPYEALAKDKTRKEMKE